MNPFPLLLVGAACLLPRSGAPDFLPGGLADAGPPKDLDPDELARGIEVELEHTSDRRIAREIALDHLTEDQHYYTKLERAGL